MEKLYLDKNNTSIEIAEIANINSKEQLVYGNYDRDLILRAKGGITLQIQNKFYKIPLQEIRTDSTITDEGMIGFIDIISNATGVFPNGYLMFETSTGSLYFYYNNTPYLVSGGGTIVQPEKGQFVSFEVLQNLVAKQRAIAIQNLGLSVSTYDELVAISPFENEYIFVANDDAHYVFRDNVWRQLYLSTLKGGIIYNKVGITNSPTVIDNNIKGLLTIPLNNGQFYTEDQKDLNGIYVGESEGLKIYSLDYANIIQGGTNKLLKITTDLSTDNIVIYGEKTSFNTENTVTYADVNIEKGLAVDNVFIKESIQSAETPTASQDYEITHGFALVKDPIGWLFSVNRIHIEDVASTYKTQGPTQTYLNESFLLVNYDTNDNGDMIATFRGTDRLSPGDLLLAVMYNKAKALSNMVQIRIISIVDDTSAIIEVVLDQKGFTDIELVKVGNTTETYALTILDSNTNSIRTVKGITNFNQLNLPDTFTEENVVVDQNLLPEIPFFNKPEYNVVFNAFGDLNGIVDDLNPTGNGFYSNNAFIKGKADLDYLRLGDQMKFENGVLTFKDGIIDGYKKYGLGVTTSVPYSITNAAGLYGVRGVSVETPLNGVSGSILRMQSGADGYQSELWLSGTMPTAAPKAYIRGLQGATKGTWSKLYTDSDITPAQITNWDTAFTWGNHAGRYPNRATLSPTGTNSVFSADTRATNPLPTTNIRQGVIFDFKQSTAIGFNTIAGTNTYAASMTFVPYTDDTGNNFSTFQLAQSAGMMGYRHYNAGTWSAWRKILTSGDYTSTNFVTTDTEQDITAIKTFTGPVDYKLGQMAVGNTLHRIENAATIVNSAAAVQTSLIIKMNNTMAAIMLDIEIDFTAYSGSVTDFNLGRSGKVKLTFYNSSAGASLGSQSASVIYGKRDLLSKVELYRDASNMLSVRLTGNFGGYAKASASLTLHHSVADAVAKTIAKAMTLEHSSDITGLTLVRTIDTNDIACGLDSYNLSVYAGAHVVTNSDSTSGYGPMAIRDLNTFKTGSYIQPNTIGSTNSPEGAAASTKLWSVIGFGGGAVNVGGQLAMSVGGTAYTTDALHFRERPTLPWKKIWTSTDFTTTNVNNWNTAFTNLVLIPIDEGNGIGYRLNGFDVNHFGNIGLNATDLSYKHALPATEPFLHLIPFAGNYGATGRYSFAAGGTNVASGNQAVAFGLGNLSSGSGSFTQGQANQATGGVSFAINNHTWASGANSFAGGLNTIAGGTNSAALGGSGNTLAAAASSSAIIGGATNTVNGTQSVILGGLRNTSSAITTLIANSQDSSITGNGSSIIGSIRATNAGDSCSIISSSDANVTAGIGSSIILASRNAYILKDATSGGGTAQAIIASTNSTINVGQPGSTEVSKFNNAIIAGYQCVINAGMSYNLVTGQGVIGTASGQLAIGLYNEDEVHLGVTDPLKKTFLIGGGGNVDLGGGVFDRKTVFYIQHNGLVVATNDIEIKDATKGYVLPSPDGSRWRITIDDAGELIRTKI